MLGVFSDDDWNLCPQFGGDVVKWMRWVVALRLAMDEHLSRKIADVESRPENGVPHLVFACCFFPHRDGALL